ncbi:biotin synthase BioB [Sporomusa termitida]|uniref:Biotin synthase n=1 Tax=Sporomusa termitida TaxID=2377 RepID=A0A517DUD9_9FIRM|nr:biotin synthase BioB [Sporomusa termitida]QDR80965.1 Biotin synthase [Sporomusa termitida]
MAANYIVTLGEMVLGGYTITAAEALALAAAAEEDILLLGAYAHKIRAKFAGPAVEMCGIINARSGLCTEDCKFCAQSVYHQTSCTIFPLISHNTALEKINRLRQDGIRRASLVTSGKGMETDPDFDRIVALIQYISQQSDTGICANLGTVSQEQALLLMRAGVKRYAHNLETSERFYPGVCTTHPYRERFDTLLAAKNAGLELCSGGIIGLGETWEDRIDLALTLRELDVASVPINILNPIAGTAFAAQPPLSPLEILKTFAIFRFILPAKVIRPAGGREINLRDMQGAVMLTGANGLIAGNYLTFSGRDTAKDFTMVYDAGLRPHLGD